MFYFVAVCNPDTDICDRLNAAPRWPGVVQTDGAYDIEGPYFTFEDCQDGRQIKNYAMAMSEGGYPVSTPWSTAGSSECYAREVLILLH